MGATGSGTVTFLFTDLVGSTALLGELGDDSFEALRRRHFRMLRDTVSGRGGREVKNLGDGLMVVFDSAVEATEAAIAMQRAVHRFNQSPEGGGMGVRIGLQVGEPIRDRDDFFGMSVVVAKRLCDQAEAGQIVASDLVCGLIGTRSGFRLGQPREVPLKGLGRPTIAYAVEWEPAPGRALVLPSLAVERDGLAFVGRSAELSRLKDAFERTGTGIQLAFLGADPGVGKTRLATEFCRRAHAAGATVLGGHCYEEALFPYQPLVAALRGYVSACPIDELRLQVGARAGELLRLVPELSERLPHLSDTSTGERHRLFDAIASLLCEAARAGPIVLLLEDLHWADAPTMLLLKHIVRTCREAPLLVLGTYRRHEVDETSPLIRAIADLRREVAVERHTVYGLARPEVSELLHAWSGQEASAEFIAEMVAETEGNPLFVRETLRHLTELGVLHHNGTRWTMTRPLAEVGVPDGVRDVIGRRLERLDKPDRRVLALAAVIGREFTLELTERSGELREGEVMDALDAALAAGLIEEDPALAGRYRFSHALVRETLYQSLSGARRAKLHRRVGVALEGLTAGREAGPHLTQLAHHFVAASATDTTDKAVDYSLRAGNWSAAALAYEDSVGHFRRAMTALSLAAPNDESRRCELLVLLGEAEWKAGEHGSAKRTLWEAAELGGRLGQPLLMARAALGIAGPFTTAGVVDERLIRLLERALREASEADAALRSRLLGLLAEQLLFLPKRFDERQTVADEAVRLARASGDDYALAEALRRALWATWSADNLTQRLELTAEMVELSERVKGSVFGATAPGWRICCLLETGDLQAVDRELTRYEALAAEIRQPYLIWHLALHRALRAHLEGRFEEVEPLAQEALSVAPDMDNAVQVGGAQIMMNRRSTGRIGELLPALEQFIERFPLITGWRATLAAALCEEGRLQEARVQFERIARARFASIPHDMFWLTSMYLCCEVAGVLGDTARARVLHDELERYGEQCVVMAPAAACLGSFSHSLGIVAGVIGDRVAASRHFERALEMNARLRSPPLVALTEYEYARVLARGGTEADHRRAWSLTASAHETAERLGMASLGPRATELLLDLAAIGAAPRDPPGRPLTGRRATPRAGG